MKRFVPFAFVFMIAADCPDDTKTETADTGDVAPDPIAAVGLQITCLEDETEVTFTPSITGAPAEAVLNYADFANNPNSFQEEHNFTFDADGAIEALTLATDPDDATGNYEPGMEALLDCSLHFDEASAVTTYAIRLYDTDMTLADCQAGSESMDEQAFLDDAGATPAGAPPSMVEDFASCGTSLAISY
ncbi:MAG: hypothetical protein AAF602_13900 [Myxococcota bacterium]